MSTLAMGKRAALAEWARCLGLLGIGHSAVWLLVGLCFAYIRPWGLHAFFMVVVCGVAAHAYQHVVVHKLSYLEALPIRASGLSLLELPQVAIAGLMIAIATRWCHYDPWSGLTLWACCAWTIATSHFFPIRRWLRVPAWILIACVAPLVSLIAYGGDGANPSWRRAAIGAVVVASLGFALSPRRIRRPLRRAPTQIVPEAAWPLAAIGPSFRPSNPNVGFRQLYRFAAPQQLAWFMWMLGGVNVAIALAVLGTPTGSVPAFWGAIVPNALAQAVAAATARRTIDFLGARPLRLRQILVSTVLPWFLCALFVPIVAFFHELASTSRSHETSARLALTALTFLFLGGVEAPFSGGPARRAMTIAAMLSPLAFMCLTIAIAPPIRLFPTPPLWSFAALAVVSAVAWYLRLPWRRLAITS